MKILATIPKKIPANTLSQIKPIRSPNKIVGKR